MREQYVEQGVALELGTVADADITVDVDRIGQSLGNLLANALRHTPAGGRVAVAAHASYPGLVAITVTDSGEGVTAEHLDHVLDRFYRADAARGPHSGGSGIGLSITRALV